MYLVRSICQREENKAKYMQAVVKEVLFWMLRLLVMGHRRRVLRKTKSEQR